MDPLNILIILIGIAIIAYAINRFGTQDVLIEKDGDILTARRLRVSREVIIYSIPGILLVLLGLMVRVIPEGKGAVLHNRITNSYHVRGPGIVLSIPYLVEITTYDTRVKTFPQKKSFSVWAPSSDGVSMGLNTRLIYRIDPGNLITYHRMVGRKDPQELIKSVMQGTLKSIISSYSSESLYTSAREEVQEKARSALEKKLSRYGISVEDLVLEEVKVSPEFSRNMEQITLSRQDAERIKYELEKKKAEKEIKELEASIIAEEIRTIGKELKNYPEYIRYLYIQKLPENVKVIISDEKSIINPDKVK